MSVMHPPCISRWSSLSLRVKTIRFPGLSRRIKLFTKAMFVLATSIVALGLSTRSSSSYTYILEQGDDSTAAKSTEVDTAGFSEVK